MPDAGRRRRPALFVHGLGGESLDWVDVALQLGDLFDCSALDLPGFAHSPPPADSDLSLDGLATTVAEVARTTNRPVHLVGNSLGGAVAVRVAAEHPELVAIAHAGRPRAARPASEARQRPTTHRAAAARRPRHRAARSCRADPEWMARRIYALCYGNPKAITPERHARELATLRQRASLDYSPWVYREALRATVTSYLDRGPRRLWQQAAAVGVPTLVISGGRDRLVSQRVAARAKRTFRDVEVLRLPEAGHVAHLEDPAAVAGGNARVPVATGPDAGNGRAPWDRCGGRADRANHAPPVASRHADPR